MQLATPHPLAFLYFLLEASGRRVVSHEVVLGGKLAAKTSFSLSRPCSPRVEELKGTALYSRLREYLLTQEQLKENGYPFPHPERPGGAVIFTAEEKKPKDREYPPSIALGRRPGC